MALGPLGPLEAALSNEWGLPVRLSPVLQRDQYRKTLWNVYGAGALSAWRQADFYQSTGPVQVARVAESLAKRPDLVFASRLLTMGPLLRSRKDPRGCFSTLMILSTGSSFATRRKRRAEWARSCPGPMCCN